MDTLFKQLHSKQLPETVQCEFFKKGKFAYEYLFHKLNDPNITYYQLCNGLTILTKMRYVGDPSKVIQKILDLTQDSRVEIRSGSICSAIALLVQSEHSGIASPPLERDRLKRLIEKSLSMGLNAHTESYAKDFIEGKVWPERPKNNELKNEEEEDL